MYSGKCRVLQGEERTEVATGEYWVSGDVAADTLRGYVQCTAPLGFRLANTADLVLEFDRWRFDLHDVQVVKVLDKSAKDIEYHGWSGAPRTEFKLKFGKAVKQKNWRPSLAKFGVP